MLLEGITGGRVKYREIKSWDSFILSWLGLMFKDLPQFRANVMAILNNIHSVDVKSTGLSRLSAPGLSCEYFLPLGKDRSAFQ